MLPKHVRYQTALHPVPFVPTQATVISLHKKPLIVKTFFKFSDPILYAGKNEAPGPK